MQKNSIIDILIGLKIILFKILKKIFFVKSSNKNQFEKLLLLNYLIFPRDGTKSELLTKMIVSKKFSISS